MRALISCFDKTGILPVTKHLVDRGYQIISTGGTYEYLRQHFDQHIITSVASVTQFPEILGGRVKTLHPAIHAGLLANRDDAQHVADMKTHALNGIDVLIVNLYPFWTVVVGSQETTTESQAIELIDIGGVAMLRAAAKNHKHVTVMSNASQYARFIRQQASNDKDDSSQMRRDFAAEVFRLTSDYDARIADYFTSTSGAHSKRRTYDVAIPLKYGCNPHQRNASIRTIDGGELPFQVLSGELGYINVLDAIGCWGLVQELVKVTGSAAAACSFKHTSPAGAAVSMEWQSLSTPSQTLLHKLYGIDHHSSPGVNAYVRSRNADPQSSFGDFIGISGEVDEVLASIIKRHVSDGIIAASYTPKALEILKTKKGGKYVVLRAAVTNTPTMEYREIGGLCLTQETNTMSVTLNDLASSKIVTRAPEVGIPDSGKLDLLVANACLKYAQSNNVACAVEGQLIGLSAGQQSRVHSVRLACSKAKVWLARHSPAGIERIETLVAKGLPFQDVINLSTNAAEASGGAAEASGEASGDASTWRVALASDAFFPFADSITEMLPINVRYVSETGGSLRDADVVAECNKHDITMVFTSKRIFTH